MKTILPYFKILRLQNALLAGIAVALGFWLGHSTNPAPALILLIIAAVAATGFGNVVNDLKDIATDRISHPGRPLPKGEMTVQTARVFAVVLALCALACAGMVSPLHFLATSIPFLLLIIYTLFLKGTPVTGNIVVSLLVAYAMLFGALEAPQFVRLIIPALLAFLLNLSREIIKDLQDKPGDSAVGIVTTASLPLSFIKLIIYSISSLYLILLFIPFGLHHFGKAYVFICAIIIVPMQIYWILLFFKREPKLPLISLLIKIEMAVGLLALAADTIVRW
jgi:geranylgeranylglycerol-phosphate geranylgeranyltransferase